jgi:hypothetical protein
MKSKPALGDTVRHTITKFEGVVVAFTTWLNGCERLSVQPEKLDKDGKPRETQVFDIQELEVLKAGSHAQTQMVPAPEVVRSKPGGDRPSVGRGQRTPERR